MENDYNTKQKKSFLEYIYKTLEKQALRIKIKKGDINLNKPYYDSKESIGDRINLNKFIT